MLLAKERFEIATASHHTLNHNINAFDPIQHDVVADGKRADAGPKVVTLPARARMA